MTKVLKRSLGAIILSTLLLPALSHAKPFTGIHSYSVVTDSADQWTLHSDVDGVKSYFRIANCDSAQVVFVKLVNSNSYEATVSWTDKIKIAGSETAIRIKTYQPSLKIPAGATLTAVCQDTAFPDLLIRLFLPNNAVVESYQLDNLTVTHN